MSKGDLSRASTGENVSIREYMMYFLGMGTGDSRSVGLGELLDEMPYSEKRVMKDLSVLEENDYVQTDEEEIYPVEVEGFNQILEETGQDKLGETIYRFDEAAFDYIESTDLYLAEQSLKYVFS